MKFVYPEFLFALAAIAIPIIIHLFNFRRYKKVLFPSVRFLKTVQEETQSKSRLKHLLVLFSRILAISFLVLAFAQPFIQADNVEVKKGKKYVSFYVDNSFSMDATGEDGTLLQEAQSKVRALVNGYGPADRFQLVTNDLKPKYQQFVTAEELVSFVDELEISPIARPLSDIVIRMNDALNNAEAPNKQAYVISDFQKSTANLNQIPLDTNIQFFALHSAANVSSNVSIDSCWFDSPVRIQDASEILHVKISNRSEEAVDNLQVQLYINDQQVAPANITIPGNASETISLNFVNRTTGSIKGKIKIEDYPVTFDDNFYFSYEIDATRNILVLKQDEDDKDPIDRMFRDDENFKVTTVPADQVELSTLKDYSVIVLQELTDISTGLTEQLAAYGMAGGSILLVPPANGDATPLNTLAQVLSTGSFGALDTNGTRVNLVNYDHYLFKDVFETRPDNLDLPAVTSYYPIAVPQTSSTDQVLSMQSGYPFMIQGNIGKGKSYMLTVPFDKTFSNLMNHAIIVPLIYNIALYSKTTSPLFYTIGDNNAVEIPGAAGNEAVYHIVGEKTDFIPQKQLLADAVKIYPTGGIINAGYYQLTDEAGKKIKLLAYNFNRDESDLACYSYDELQDAIAKNNLSNWSLIEPQIKNLAGFAADADQGNKLWKWCLIICLVFLAIETVLLKFWRT